MVESVNISLVRRWFEEVWNQRRTETIDELLDAEARCYDMTAPDSIIIGQKAFRAAAEQLYGAFGKMHIAIEDIFDSGDKVAVRISVYLKHTGPLGGLAATHREITVPGMCIIHLRNGKLIAGWNNWDIASVLQVAKAPPDQRALF